MHRRQASTTSATWRCSYIQTCDFQRYLTLCRFTKDPEWAERATEYHHDLSDSSTDLDGASSADSDDEHPSALIGMLVAFASFYLYHWGLNLLYDITDLK